MSEELVDRLRTWAAGEVLDAEARSRLEAALGDDATMTLGPAALAAEAPSFRSPERYQERGPLGRGGMGEVHRVEDTTLRRAAAMKVLQGRYQGSPVEAAFVREAQLTAGLQHPGVVPVYELGALPDGRPYFTMKVIQGQTLALRLATGSDSLRRRVGWLLAVAQAVAYAHSRGIVHRDLKPANVMLGAFGVTTVLDWGLAATTAEPVALQAGTPGYLAPECIGASAACPAKPQDVFALGAMLYEVLAGTVAYPGGPSERMAATVQGLPPRPAGVPDELADLCMAALASDPADRPADAGAIATVLSDWLEGAARRARALATTAEATALWAELAVWREDEAVLAVDFAVLQKQVPGWASVERRRPLWHAEERLSVARERVVRGEIRYEHLLTAALEQAPDLTEARRALADLYQTRHAAAEKAQRPDAARIEAQLRHHDHGWHTAWLDGRGEVVLQTEPPGLAFDIVRYVPQERRLVAEVVVERLTSPITMPMPMGRYAARFGDGTVYPFEIVRCGRWESPVLRLPRCTPSERFVAPGWFRADGDVSTNPPRPARRLWLDGFIMARCAVTNAEYIAFLNDLVATGQEEQALARCPHAEGSESLLGRDGDGRFHTRSFEGFDIAPDWPVMLISWNDAVTYCDWLAERTGLPWRLPLDSEVEKASRGVDGRFFPWGDRFEAQWACTRPAFDTQARPAPVGTWPADESPYGIRDLGGNMRTWCLDDALQGAGTPVVDQRVIRDIDAQRQRSASFRYVHGGAWSFYDFCARGAQRNRLDVRTRQAQVGIRLTRSWPE